MQLRRLRAFLLVVDQKNFSAAADVLGLTQPAISKQIKLLEEELGVQLLYREGHSVEPTEVGRHLYKKARDLLQMWDSIVNECRAYHGELSGMLRIGASTVPGSYLLPEWLRQFQAQYPRVEVRVSVHDSLEVMHMVREGTIDVGIIGGVLRDEGIVDVSVAKDQLVLIGPVGREGERLGDWLQLPFIFREQGSGSWEAVEVGLRQRGIESSDLQCVARVDSTEAVISMVEAGLGYSFVSSLAATPAARYGRVAILDELPGDRDFRVIYLASKKDSQLLSAFLGNVIK